MIVSTGIRFKLSQQQSEVAAGGEGVVFAERCLLVVLSKPRRFDDLEPQHRAEKVQIRMAVR